MRGSQKTLRLAAVIVIGSLLAGCAGTDAVETASLAAKPIPAGKARVTIARSSTIMYSGVPATITLNGTTVANIAVGGAAVFDVPAGDNVIAASAWSYPGTYSLKLAARAGERYALAVEPRSASLGPSMLGPVGGLIDAHVNENAGAFELKAAPVAAPDKKGT